MSILLNRDNSRRRGGLLCNTHHVLHEAGHVLEVSGAHLTGVGPLGDVLLAPAVILQLGHAPDKLAGGLVPADEVKHLAPGIVLAPTPGAGPGLHVLHSVDGAAEPLLAAQGTSHVPGLVNL